MSPSTPIDRGPFDDAYVAMLAAATQLPVGKHGIPRVPQTVNGRTEQVPVTTKPYLVVYDAGTSYLENVPFADDADRDLEIVTQVTAVGERDDQVKAALKRARDATLGRLNDAYTNDINAAGLSVMTRRWDSDGGRHSEGTIVSHAERFAFMVTPA